MKWLWYYENLPSDGSPLGEPEEMLLKIDGDLIQSLKPLMFQVCRSICVSQEQDVAFPMHFVTSLK